MQAMISRFGGMPAMVLKLVFLGLVNALAILAFPTMISTQAWLILGIVIASTIALDYLFLTKKFIPAKYVIIGAIFLTAFQIIPVIYNISIAFTNYSTGHIGTQPEAIEAIVRDSAAQTENSVTYDMIPATDSGGDLVLILTPQVFADEAAVTDPATTDPVETEFGGTDEPVETEFGGEGTTDSASPVPSGDGDMNVATPADDTSYPPTYIGTPGGIDEVEPSTVQRDEFGTVTGVEGYTNVPESDLASNDAALAGYDVPGPDGGLIQPQGLSTAVELEPTLVYDPVADTFTSLQTGTVYTDNGEGSYTDPNNPDDELLPGWRETVGFKNFFRIFSDPDISGPFFIVFVWTFVYAIVTVLLTFALGLGLAIVMNKPGMRGQRVYRSLLVIPYAVPAFLSILVWAALLNDDFGAINQVLGTSIPWLFDPTWAKVSCILVNLWLGLPYMFLISTGALQAIPSELQEAARVDGARNWQVFRLVNLPLLLVALTPLLIASFAFNFNNFNNIYLLTGGGPAMDGSNVAGATDILISYTYKVAFAAGKGNDYGLAAAVSIIIFMIVGTISAISFSRSKAIREERA
ncbi:MAG: ABC transporter permease subunit [Actinomycetota bacterium]|nr:ABC transporter permease subunit [Actinomycetota bacterium]